MNSPHSLSPAEESTHDDVDAQKSSFRRKLLDTVTVPLAVGLPVILAAGYMQFTSKETDVAACTLGATAAATTVYGIVLSYFGVARKTLNDVERTLSNLNDPDEMKLSTSPTRLSEDHDDEDDPDFQYKPR